MFHIRICRVPTASSTCAEFVAQLERQGWKKTGSVIFCGFCLFAFPALTFGEAWILQPSVHLRQEYDDNIGLSIVDPISTFGTLVSGRLGVSRLTERVEISARAQADFVHYTEDELRDEANQFFDFSSLYRATELSRWRLDGSYRRDTTLVTERVETEPEDIDPGITEFRIRRNRLVLNPSWSRDLTEKTGVQLGYGFTGVFYSDAERADLVDFYLHRGEGGIFHRLTERDVINATLEFSRFEAPDEDRTFDSYALTAGIDHRFSETLQGQFSVGVRHTSFDTPARDGDETGFLARATLTKRTELARFRGTVERRLLPSGVGNLVQTDQLILTVDRSLTPRLDFSLRSRAFRSESISDDRVRDERRFIFIEPVLRQALTEEWSLEGSYRYRWRRIVDDDASADSNAFFIALTYTPLVGPGPR